VKFVPSALIGQLSRSAGSTTASRNRFGSYLRNRVTPVNPRTPIQTLQRTIVQELSQLWRTLTPEGRAGWGAFGLNYNRQDSLGQSYTLTGLQAFTSVNRNRRVLGLSDLTVAPEYLPPGDLDTLTLTGSAVIPVALSVAFTPTPLTGSARLVLAFTRQLSAGVAFVPRSEYRNRVVTAEAAASPVNVLSAYTSRFGALVAGRRIFVRASLIDANGISSTPLETSAIVAGPA